MKDEQNIAQSFLSPAPPHWAARGISYAIIAVVLIAGIASVVIKLPETVTADFELVPERGSDPIKATRQGIASHVFVSEGQSVNKGDVIVVLRSESVGDRSADLMTIQTQLAGAGESFINAKAKFSAQTLAGEQESRKLADRIEHLQSLSVLKRQQLVLLKQMADSYEKLFREGIASRAQLTERQLDVANLSAELEKISAEQNETRAEIDKQASDTSARRAEFNEVERGYREATATSEIRVAALRAALAGSDGNEIRVTAPCSGTILRLYVRNSGAVVHEGAAVAELVCSGETLQAELKVPEAGVGKLQTGQGVKLKYDAFPYQRYGVRYGRLAWLSPSTVETKEGASFRARVEIADTEMAAQGQSRPLFAGMSGKAEIVIGSRSLIEYVFEPLKQLKENFSDAPATISQR
jgi:HlyD family type I secretion membrane fusion protein